MASFAGFLKALPLTSFTDMTCRLVLAESVLIPASSSLVCNAKIQSYDGSLMQAVGERIFLPGEKMLDSHLVATSAVVDCTSGIVPVHIVNVHEEDRTLFKNVTLGTLETVNLASADESPGTLQVFCRWFQVLKNIHRPDFVLCKL